MMINIRYGLFETNSSSVHSIVIMNKKHYDLLEVEDHGLPEYFVYLEYNKETITPDDISVLSVDEMKEKIKEYNSDANTDDFQSLAREASCLDYYTINNIDARGEFDDYVICDFEFYE